jgi:hypothetical protein
LATITAISSTLIGPKGRKVKVEVGAILSFESRLSVKGATMSYMFEVYYQQPPDLKKEARLAERVSHLGGRLDYREECQRSGSPSICLTFEFDNLDQARSAAAKLREQGEYVEGPVDYGAE